MEDYSQYAYKRLLEFLQDGYKHDTIRKNFAEYLLSMKNAKSIKELMKIYNFVFVKIAMFIYDCPLTKMPSYWHRPAYWSNYREYLALELNYCLNENILRLCKSFVNPTKQQCISCLVNLRYCEEIQSFQDNIISTYQYGDKNELIDVSSKRDRVHKIREEIYEFATNTNGYSELKDEYVLLMRELKSQGLIKTVGESEFEVEKDLYNGGSFSTGQKIFLIIVLFALILIVLSKVDFMAVIIIIGLVICCIGALFGKKF